MDIAGVVTKTLISDWEDTNTTVTSSDNSGSSVTNPTALITATPARKINADRATIGMFCVKYPSGASALTDAVIRIFGIDSNGVPGRCLSASGASEQTCTSSTTNDTTDGTWKYTAAVEVDLAGYHYFIATVKTAFAGTAITGAKLLWKGK
jgi:hypothetical protein